MQSEKPRAQQAERVKTAILDAAIPLFAKGFDGVSVKQIAAAAGHKHSLVMYHFGTKEALWEQAARLLMQRFDQSHRSYLAKLAPSDSDRDTVHNQLFAFIQTLRDLPAYGQILLSEGSQTTERLRWLHENYFPSILGQTQFADSRVGNALKKTTLLRSAIAGAMLYTVVAAPQIARSAEMEGVKTSTDIYPLSDGAAARLAQMLTELLFSHLDSP